MADDRAEQIARIEQVERIKALEARQPADPAQPGTAAIGSPDGKTGEQEQRPWYSVTPKGLAQGALDALPVAGSTLGEIGGPAGAGMGMAAGKNLKGLLEQYLMGKEPPTREEYYKGLATAAQQGTTGSMAGASIATAAAPALKYLANTQAFKALGPYAKAAKQYLPGGKAQEIGETALNEGIVGGLPTTFKGIADRAQAVKQASGKKVGDLLEGLGASEATPTINRKDIADQLRTELLEPAHGDVATVAAKNDTLKGVIDHFEKGGEDAIPLLEAEMKKRAIDQNINWMRPKSADVPVAEEADKALRGKLSSAVDDKAVSMDAANDTTMGADFLKAKKTYDNASKAVDISSQKQAHELAKQLLAPGIGGTVGFAHGNDLEDRLKNMAYGIGGGLALRGGQLYGPQIVAPLANGLSNMAAKIPASAWPYLSKGLINKTEGE